MFLLTKTKKQWNLLYKTAIWAIGLSLAVFSGFSWYGTAVFLIIALWAYFSSSVKRSKLRSTYWFSSIISFGLLILQTNASDSVVGSTWLSVVLILIFALLILSIFGIFEDKFVNKNLVYKIINTVVLILLFVFFLTLTSPFSLGFYGIFLFFGVSFLFNELLSFFNVTIKRRLFSSFIIGFLCFELTWIVLLFPLGILNGAALLTLFMCVTRDFLIAHFKGELKSAFIFQQFTFLILVGIIIFASSNWGL